MCLWVYSELNRMMRLVPGFFSSDSLNYANEKKQSDETEVSVPLFR